MKEYTYYPGCSDEATGIAYGLTISVVAEALGMQLNELEDWNCCGTSPYHVAEELEALCVAGRNLAIAEEKGLDIVTGCNACYVTLGKTNQILSGNPEIKAKANEALAEANLKFNGGLNVRHILEVIVNDLGYEEIAAKASKKLEGLKVASYYGCQLTRPGFGFDDKENPQSMDKLVEAIGGTPVQFEMKARCCGASMVMSEEDLAVGLINKILKNAVEAGADCIIAACPLCQLNLDAYQAKAKKKNEEGYEIPVLFFTQLLGLALGLPEKELALKKGIVSCKKVLAPYL
ncbi:CoB--CoM heterodisulfide reductase iron-sulfur subunit B family protein [Chloroflexota bacterium]